MRIVALDCDGTLVYGSPNGPVDPIALKKKGYLTVLVSSSKYCIDKEGFDDVIPSRGDDAIPSRERKRSLIKVKQKYPNAEEYIYISDNLGDEIISKEVGFRYVHPKKFSEDF